MGRQRVVGGHRAGGLHFLDERRGDQVAQDQLVVIDPAEARAQFFEGRLQHGRGGDFAGARQAVDARLHQRVQRRDRLAVVAQRVADHFVGNHRIALARDHVHHRQHADQLRERRGHAGIAKLTAHHRHLAQHVVEAVRHAVAGELVFQRAGHAARNLVLEQPQVEFVRHAERESCAARNFLEVFGDRRQQAAINPVRVAGGLDVAQHRLDRRQRRAVRQRTRAGVQHGDAVADRFQVQQRRDAVDVVRVNLKRLAECVVANRRDQALRPFGRQHAGSVVDDEAIDRRVVGEQTRLAGVERIGVHRAQRVHQRGHHLGIELLGHRCQTMGFVDVPMQHIVDPEAAHAVAAQAPHPEVHQAVGRDRHRDDPGVAHAPAHARIRHRGDQQVEAGPGVLGKVAHHDFHHRAAHQVDHLVAGAVDQRRDRQRHAGAHLHAPQALLAVAQRGVDELDVCHALRCPGTPATAWSPTSAC